MLGGEMSSARPSCFWFKLPLATTSIRIVNSAMRRSNGSMWRAKTLRISSEARVACQVFGRPLQRDLARFEHVAIVGDLQRGARVLLDEQDRDAGRAQGGDGREDLAHDERREAQARLVEHEQ